MKDEVHSAQRVVPAPVEQVFALVSDPHEHLAWLPPSEYVTYECEYESGPPRGVGATYIVSQNPLGRRKPIRTRSTVSVYEPPHRVEFVGQSGMATLWELWPSGEQATQVTCSRIYRGAKPGRGLNRIVKPETVIEALERDLRRLSERLKALAEDGG